MPRVRSLRNVRFPFRGVALAAGWVGAALVAGCQTQDHTPPPGPGGPPVYQNPRAGRELEKPLPDPRRAELPPPPYDDPPLLNQVIPEARAFVDAYNRSGQPRIAVFVNRTLRGDVVPVQRPPEQRVDGQRFDDGLPPGEVDEVAAKNIDYNAIEAKLADWLSADRRVRIIAAHTIRERLTDEQVAQLQQGRPRVVGEVAKSLNADILIQVTARPTHQGRDGIEVRLIAEAIDVLHGGDVLGQAVVPVPPPLDTPKINKYTRFIARKLMSDMTAAWSGPPGEPPPPPRPGEAGPGTVPGPGTGPGPGPAREFPGGPVRPETDPGAIPGVPPDGGPPRRVPDGFPSRDDVSPGPGTPGAPPPPPLPAPSPEPEPPPGAGPVVPPPPPG